MKKYLLVVFCFILVLAVTGCGNKNQVICTGTEVEEGVEIKAEVIGDFDKNDKLTDATAVYDLGDNDTASQWCSFFKLMQDEEHGITIDCSGSKITIKGYGNASEESEESMIGMTKSEFKAIMQEQNLTCK